MFIFWLRFILYVLKLSGKAVSHWMKYAEMQLSLIYIFPDVGRIVSIFSKYGKIRIQFGPYWEKYGLEKARISAYFTVSC